MHLFDRLSLVGQVTTRLDPRLQSAIDGIVALARPDAVLLFGGRSRGDSDDASDWDLFVVLPDDVPPGIARPSALRRAAAPAKLLIHAVACRRSVFEARSRDPNSLSHAVARDGPTVAGHDGGNGQCLRRIDQPDAWCYLPGGLVLPAGVEANQAGALGRRAPWSCPGYGQAVPNDSGPASLITSGLPAVR